jgi:hypothetical protein
MIIFSCSSSLGKKSRTTDRLLNSNSCVVLSDTLWVIVLFVDADNMIRVHLNKSTCTCLMLIFCGRYSVRSLSTIQALFSLFISAAFWELEKGLVVI